MEQQSSPTHELLASDQWCWNYLLVDGISLPEAEKQLYQTSEFPDYLNLYAGTDWDPVADVAPLLIAITEQDPFVGRFMTESFASEWGVLIKSSQDLPTLATQLRQCLTVRHPTGSDLVLRLADPGVVAVLFTELEVFGRTCQGVEALLVPDALRWEWQFIAVTPRDAGGRSGPVTLSDEAFAVVAKVDERSLLRNLVAHLDRFFPSWDAMTGRSAGVDRLSRMISRARAAGYSSERSLTQWANVFGFSGAPEKPEMLSPAILGLLDSPPEYPDVEYHAREAAILARSASKQREELNSRTELLP